jgi:hypothetical protein
MSDHQEVIEVLYNECYGGFGISKEALELYNKKRLQQNPDAEIIKTDCFFGRTDPILLEVYHEMNGDTCDKSEGFNGRFARVRVEKIPAKYKNCYYIDEYDGSETVDINYKKLEVIELKEIANDETLTYEERIRKIQAYTHDITWCNNNDSDNV